ncbi:hypothetical protein [Nonomuraea aridisoli]|uniref:Uncharacterized protein n=1 Tax=Nonomuraea aridisoli TaxID=2070368 RepID=A0A2W2DUN6_9ACTN|nr:hypothetical protein [Nonomuraea aridisoli]PZG04860.1 hypothetical protein C1J01_44115 [Nonomuraea aridisoli]
MPAGTLSHAVELDGVAAPAWWAVAASMLLVIGLVLTRLTRRARRRAAARARAGRVPEARKSWSAAVHVPEEDGEVRAERVEEDWESREVREAVRAVETWRPPEPADRRGSPGFPDRPRPSPGSRDLRDGPRGPARERGAAGRHGPGPPSA